MAIGKGITSASLMPGSRAPGTQGMEWNFSRPMDMDFDSQGAIRRFRKRARAIVEVDERKPMRRHARIASLLRFFSTAWNIER